MNELQITKLSTKTIYPRLVQSNCYHYGDYIAYLGASWPDDVPQPIEVPPNYIAITVPCYMLKHHLKTMADQDVRFYLNGVYFDLEEKTLVSSDGHTMITSKIEHDGAPVNFILPRDFVCALVKQYSDKQPIRLLFVGNNYVRVDFSNGIMQSRTIDAQYPPYKSLLPSFAELRDCCYTIDKYAIAYIKAELKKAEHARKSQKEKPVGYYTLCINGFDQSSIQLLSKFSKHELHPIVTEGTGARDKGVLVPVHINAEYMLRFWTGENITLTPQNGFTSLYIESGGDSGVIMPLRQ